MPLPPSDGFNEGKGAGWRGAEPRDVEIPVEVEQALDPGLEDRRRPVARAARERERAPERPFDLSSPVGDVAHAHLSRKEVLIRVDIQPEKEARKRVAIKVVPRDRHDVVSAGWTWTDVAPAWRLFGGLIGTRLARVWHLIGTCRAPVWHVLFWPGSGDAK